MNCTKKVAIVSVVACVLSAGSASGSGSSDTSGLFTATSASGSITVAVDDTTSNSGSGSVINSNSDVNGVTSVNEDIDWASMAADDEWVTVSSNEIIEFGSVITPAVDAVAEVLATPDDVVIEGQVLVHGVLAVDQVLAGPNDIVVLDQVITPGVLAVDEVLAIAGDVVVLNQLITPAVIGVEPVLAGPNDVIILGQILVPAVIFQPTEFADGDAVVVGVGGDDESVIKLNQVLSKSVAAVDAILAGPDDVIAVGDILTPVVAVDAVLATEDDIIVEDQLLTLFVESIDAVFVQPDGAVALGQELEPSVDYVPAVLADSGDVVVLGEVLKPSVDYVPAVLATAEQAVVYIGPFGTTAAPGPGQTNNPNAVIVEGQVLEPSIAAVPTVFAGPDDVVAVGDILEPAVDAKLAVLAGPDDVLVSGQLLTPSVDEIDATFAVEGDVVAVGDTLVDAVVVAADAVLATEDDVVAVGDVLVAGVAAADAVLATADDVVAVGDVLIAAVEGVTEILATEDDVVAVGDVLVAGVAAADAVLATADDVVDSFRGVADISDSDMSAATHGLSSDEISGAITDIANSGVLKSEVGLSKADKLMVTSTGFALALDPVLKTAYNTAMVEIASGATTVAAVRTKLNTDVGSVGAVASAGINSANSVIGGHQQNLVANSGKYGLNKYSLAISGDNGVSSGSSALGSGYWLQVFGSDSNMGTRDGVAGYDANVHGVALGFDRKIGDDMMVGVAFNYSAIDVEGKSVANSQTDTDQYQGVIYGTMFGDNHFINGSVAYAHGASDTSRTTIAGGTASGSYDTGIFSASVGVGMPMDKATWSITPQVTAAYSHVNPDSYTENGPGALNVNPDSIDLFGIKAGVTINTKVDMDGGVFMPELRLVADWDVLQERAEVTSSWVSTGAVLATGSAPKPAALGAIIGTGVDYASDDGVYVLSMDYDLGVRPDFTSHSISGKFRVNF